MTATLGKTRKNSSLLIVTLVTLVVSCLAGSLAVALPQAASAATVSDNFDRANGALGEQLDDGYRDGCAEDREQHPAGGHG